MFYEPLKNQAFRYVWIVMLFSNIGTWIHTITSSIFITTLSSSSLLISLLQVSVAAPIFLFSIPAGVFADIYDRKSIIVSAQIIMALIAFFMALITFFDSMSLPILLGLTFLLNIGLAFNQPAWQAISSTLVPKNEIKQAAALNNLSFNLSRCIGPAVAGYFFMKLGPAYLYFINSISFVIATFVFRNTLLKRDYNEKISINKIYTGFFDGVSLHKKFPAIKFLFSKAFIYFLFSSSIWSLLPYIIIVHNGMEATDLGLLTCMVGLGAIINAYSIYYLRKKISETNLTSIALFLTGLVILSIWQTKQFNLLAIIMFVFGYSWSISVSVFNGNLQADFPLEIRSRIIGIYCVMFAGAQALSSYLSGVIVQSFGLRALFSISLIVFIICGVYFLDSVLKWKLTTRNCGV